MKIENEFSSFQETKEHFLAHLKAAKEEEIISMELTGEWRAFLDDFVEIVEKESEYFPSSDNHECMVFGATKYQALGEEDWRIRGLVFDIVDKVECRLLGARCITGLSLNVIHSHFTDELNQQRPYCFVWKLPLWDMTYKAELPDLEWKREEHELHKKWRHLQK